MRVSEAPSYGKPVLVYDLKCVGSEAYLRLATEIIQREKELSAGTSRRRTAPRDAGPAAGRARERATRRNEVSAERWTMADDGRSRLGRGLAALIGDVGAETRNARARAQPSAACRSNICRPNPRNPRRNFSDAELEELAASIKERGIIQPIVVRAVRGAKDAYEIIAGERRWRAAQRAGLHEVPIVLRRGDRRRGARACHHRERAAHRPQCAGRGGRLSGAGERVRSQPRRDRQDRRQEPQPCHQHAAAAEAVGADQGLYQRRQAHSRPCAHADRRSRPEAMAREIVERGLNVRQVEALAQGAREASEGKRQAQARSEGRRHALRSRGALSDALGLTVTSITAARAACCTSSYRTSRAARRGAAAAGAGLIRRVVLRL